MIFGLAKLLYAGGLENTVLSKKKKTDHSLVFNSSRQHCYVQKSRQKLSRELNLMSNSAGISKPCSPGSLHKPSYLMMIIEFPSHLLLCSAG